MRILFSLVLLLVCGVQSFAAAPACQNGQCPIKRSFTASAPAEVPVRSACHFASGNYRATACGTKVRFTRARAIFHRFRR